MAISNSLIKVLLDCLIKILTSISSNLLVSEVNNG